jgi:hypothetical protein
MRCLTRRLSDVVYRQLVADQRRRRAGEEADPGGQAGAATGSSAVDSNPNVDTSEKSLPGPASDDPTPATPKSTARSSTVPGALKQRRPAAVVKRTLFDVGEDRRTLPRRERQCLDTEGSHERVIRVTRQRLVVLGTSPPSGKAWADPDAGSAEMTEVPQGRFAPQPARAGERPEVGEAIRSAGLDRGRCIRHQQAQQRVPPAGRRSGCVLVGRRTNPVRLPPRPCRIGRG